MASVSQNDAAVALRIEAGSTSSRTAAQCQDPGASCTKSRHVPQEQEPHKKQKVSPPSSPSSPIESKVTTGSSALSHSTISSEAAGSAASTCSMTLASETMLEVRLDDDEDDNDEGEALVHEEGVGVEADQGTSTSAALDPNEFIEDTNFVPRPGSYRTSHEKGRLHFSLSVGLFDDEDDSDDDDESPFFPAAQ